MGQQIVGLSIDKVQSFLFETIHAHEQEKQAEAATLRSIMNSSREISVDFFKSINSTFGESKTKELLKCSGVYIFACSLSVTVIKDKLNQLFVQHYHSSEGQKLLRYVCFSKRDLDDIGAIQKAKRLLKDSSGLNKTIGQNKATLFQFSSTGSVKGPCANTDKKDDGCYPKFAGTINKLFHADEAENENRFRIAVIKADLDGMGALFKEIEDYDDYRKVSQILNENISLDSLHEAARVCCPDKREGWLFPFYIAGDDIFFAVSAPNLIKGIDVCRKILEKINTTLKNEIGSTPNRPSLKLTMSIGVEITYNRQPIRYYLEMVENQLANAKKEKAPELFKQYVQSKISICSLTFFLVDYHQIKVYKEKECTSKKQKEQMNCELDSVPIWNFFVNEVKTLHDIMHDAKHNDIRAQGIGTPGYFYTLLERLTNEDIQNDDAKYLNSVFYHLSPKFLESSNQELREYELLLNTGIMKQLYQKPEHGNITVLRKATKHRLETYLRLMLLFSDHRYHMANKLPVKQGERFDKSKQRAARKFLFTRTKNYLFEAVHKNKALGNIFAIEQSYVLKADKDHNENTQVKCLQRLRIERSMFFKLRDTRRIPIRKAIAMIEIHNPSTENDRKAIEDFNNTRVENRKAPYQLFFDKSAFQKEADGWTPDFIDSLMLLYEYNEHLIRYKSLYPKETKK